MSQPRKRSRSDFIGPLRQSTPASRGMWATSKFSKLHPWDTYGAARMERGSEFTQNNFGTSYKEATPEQRSNRKRTGYTGRGKYWGKMLGGALGSIGGMFVGGPKGAVVGGKLGSHYGDKWSGRGLYEGRGSYAPVTNSLMAGSASTPATFQSVDDETGALCISHKEYIADIFGNESTESFKNRTYSINPGLERTFPWLSQIAQNYEEYEMIQCVFEFRSTVAVDVASNGQVGTIVMVTNYNAGARPFSDKNTMMQYDGCMSSKTTQSMVHGVECDPDKRSGAAGNFIRANPVITGEDIKTYDHGVFQLASVGLPDAYANDNIGELWISYTVKLRKPRLFSGKGLNLSRDQYVVTTTAQDQFLNMSNVIGTGVQNNIGTKINFVSSASSVGSYDLLFPASYAGNLEIRVLVNGSIETTTNNTAWRRMFATDAAVAGVYEFLTGTTGNIKQRKDLYGALPVSNSDPEWYVACTDDLATGTTNDQVMVTFHVKIGIATDGVDNKLRFNLPQHCLAGNQLSIDISEYNTFDLALEEDASFVYQGTKLPYNT